MIFSGNIKRISSERVWDLIFFGISALFYVASTAVTMAKCTSMSKMNGMPMPGDWTMSMVWMRMPGQTWLDAALSFFGMWIAMMVAMMLPSLVSMLSRYRKAVGSLGETTLGRLTMLVSVGYFLAWTMFGMATYLLGIALTAIEMEQAGLARAVPMAVGLIILLAGAVQFTPWKIRHLSCCRELPGYSHVFPVNVVTAWRYGLRLGLHCVCCCIGLSTILLVVGIMDLRAMAVITTAITLERLASSVRLVVQSIGVVAVGSGLFLIARAAGL